MNNYYTLIYLKHELKRNFLAAKFRFAVSPRKNVLTCYLEKDDTIRRLIFSSDPNETALFYDDYRPPPKRNVFSFFTPLEDRKITDIALAKYDRLLSVYFGDGLRLLFKLFGSRANAFLVRDDKIEDAFQNPEPLTGQKPPAPQPPDFNQTVTAGAKPKNQMTRINPLLPRNLLPPLIKQHNVQAMTVAEVKDFTHQVTDALKHNPHPRVLGTGQVCLWSTRWLDVPTEKSFDSVNACIRHAYRQAVHLRRLHRKKERVRLFLEQTAVKKKAEYEQLRQADKSLKRADEYEKWANLLMSHAHESVPAGSASIEVKDIYEGDEPITIALKKNRSLARNAERYYEKAKASRKSYRKAKQRAPKVKKESERAKGLLQDLEAIDRLPELNQWIKKHKSALEAYGYGSEDEGQAVSPFRKYKVGKYEVWLGKNARSNDQLTSRAHKEDIWLHARGVSGSHAVIRMGNEPSYPPKEVILRAASFAAYYSKARGAKTVPVMYTKCKYVYKPSGSAPGAALAKREEVVMVPPAKPQ